MIFYWQELYHNIPRNCIGSYFRSKTEFLAHLGYLNIRFRLNGNRHIEVPLSCVKRLYGTTDWIGSRDWASFR